MELGQPRSLWAVNSAWQQHKLSGEGGCSLNHGLWAQCPQIRQDS